MEPIQFSPDPYEDGIIIHRGWNNIPVGWSEMGEFISTLQSRLDSRNDDSTTPRKWI